jgi:DNA gyrase/topoisomerase IV subunit B
MLMRYLPPLPLLSDCKADENWTCITFYPDLERFGMEELEAETVELMRKRVYDMAGILGKSVKVRIKQSAVSCVGDFEMGTSSALER